MKYIYRKLLIILFTFTIATIAYYLCRCVFNNKQKSDRENSASTELEISKKGFDKADISYKLNNMILDDWDICGQWHSENWHESLTLDINKTGNNDYNVVISVNGDVGFWKLFRKASFKNGLLVFDRPILDYGSNEAYRYVYLLRVHNAPVFLTHPIAKLIKFEENKSEYDKSSNLFLLKQVKIGKVVP